MTSNSLPADHLLSEDASGSSRMRVEGSSCTPNERSSSLLNGGESRRSEMSPPLNPLSSSPKTDSPRPAGLATRILSRGSLYNSTNNNNTNNTNNNNNNNNNTNNNQESSNSVSQGSVVMEEHPTGYSSIRIDGDECDADFSQCADTVAAIIESRHAYKALDKGQNETALSAEVCRAITFFSPHGTEESNAPLATGKRVSAETTTGAAEVSAAAAQQTPAMGGESSTQQSGMSVVMDSMFPRLAAPGSTLNSTTSIGLMTTGGGGGGEGTGSSGSNPSILHYQDGVFSFMDMKTKIISWEQYIKDMRAVYGAIENGPCLSMARMRLTTISQKFHLYSLLNSENENNYDDYIKGGVYANCTKVDNAIKMYASVPAPTLLDFIVTSAKENPRIPLFVDPETETTVTLQQFLREGGVENPEEITAGGLGLHPSQLTKKSTPLNVLNPVENPSGKFGATLLNSFLSMAGPCNGDLFGVLIRSELERSEFKEQHVVCTERLIDIHGHHPQEVRQVAVWLRNQGFHNFNRNMWVLALQANPPCCGPNTLPVTAKTVHDQLHNMFYPLFMSSLYPTHPEWREVAQMLHHTSAISFATGTKVRSKNLSSRMIHPNSLKYGTEVSEYYYFYYFWSNVATLNALRRGLGLNTFHFTASIHEKAPAFDQLVCSYLLCDVVYHARSLSKSWIMQYLYTMCRIGVVCSPLRDNQLDTPYFDHPVVQFFRQGMQVSLTTSVPLHCHHRVDQPLVEEYATMLKLHSLTPQDLCELARNSVLNSNFPITNKQEWLGENFTPLGSFGNDMGKSCVCNYRLQFRQETMLHETTLLNMVRSQNAQRRGIPPPPLVHPSSIAEAMQMPDLVEQFKSARRLNYIDKRVVYPRIYVEDAGQHFQMFEVVEMLRQVLMLRRKYTNSYASDVKVEDVFNSDHHFDESNYEYNNYYGVYVLSGVGKCPSWPSFIPTVRDFIKDVSIVRHAVTSNPLQRMASHRLSLLERKFLLHLSMNISNEAGKREEKEWNNRDFFTAHKVDNNIHTDAGLNARTLLEYFVDKAQNHGDDVVFEERNSPITLRQLIQRYNIDVNRITVDELNYQMSSHPDLRAIFLSPDNFMQGRYFAELTKKKLEIDKEDAYSFAENRLRIHATAPQEWYMLAHWFDRYGMASSQNRWMISLPRNYKQLRQKDVVRDFGQFIDHLFSALWDISLHPAKDPRFHYFLAHVSGFDCADEESKIDMNRLDNTFPHDWNTLDNPPYAMYMYYFWANIASLNEFRASRGLGTFTFRPQCGEFGHGDHLIAGFLLANSINHGVTLSKHPVLEYLYYLAQIGVAMSPLSNTSGASAYLENPFPQYFHRGLLVSLATNQPLFFHFTREPLIEEYSIAAKLWKFEFNDLSEIARNSVLQSGFPNSWKAKVLGDRFYLRSTLGNDVRKTRVSDIRVAFRFETYHNEIDYLDTQLGSMQRVPRAMFSLEEEQHVVDRELTSGNTPDPEVEAYVASLRQGQERATSPLRQKRTIKDQLGIDVDAERTRLNSRRKRTSATTPSDFEEEEKEVEGSIDFATTKEFLIHDIKAYEHRIKELSTCMLMLADSNNTIAEEIQQLLEHQKRFEQASVMQIRGNIEGARDAAPSVEASLKLESVQGDKNGPELWVHEENRMGAPQ